MFRSAQCNDVVTKTASSPIPIVRAGKSMRMSNHKDPCCIADVEFDFIYNFVKKHKLKNGYEIATAFGVSMLAPALAMKEHGGRLVTMDAYIEEQHNYCMGYTGKVQTYQNADGFKVANNLMDIYELRDVVNLVVGFSPQDTRKALETKFDLSKEKLDYVFIDGLHTDDAAIKDLRAVLPFINRDRFVVFFHDTHCFGPITKKFVRNQLGKHWTLIPKCGHPNGDGFNLAMVTNLE